MRESESLLIRPAEDHTFFIMQTRLLLRRISSGLAAPTRALGLVLAALLFAGVAPTDLRADTTLNSGTTTVSTGTWANSSNLTVGYSGTGTLTVNGGLVTSGTGYLGSEVGSNGTATVSSGTWANSGQLQVGRYGTGTLDVHGGSVTSTYGYIGSFVGGSGTATITSGTWANSSNLYVGYSGTGVLDVNGGSVTSTSSVLSLIGGVGGSLTLLSYNYLLRHEGLVAPGDLRAVRWDLAVAYAFTVVFGISVMLIANRVFYSAGIAITDREAISRMAGALEAFTGRIGFFVYSIGFLAAVVASLFGVWQTIPTVISDCFGLLRRVPRDRREAAARPGAPGYRKALLFMAISSVPFVLLGKPLVVIIAFTVLGSFFIPFLAATLLYLNIRAPIPESLLKNRQATNFLLGLIVLLFLVVGAWEIADFFPG